MPTLLCQGDRLSQDGCTVAEVSGEYGRMPKRLVLLFLQQEYDRPFLDGQVPSCFTQAQTNASLL